LVPPRLLELTPATNEVRDAPRPPCCSGLWFITGDDERLWIASYTNANMVSFDPQRRRFGPAVCCGVRANAIALGESALWVVEREDEQVLRMNLDTARLKRPFVSAPRGRRDSTFVDRRCSPPSRPARGASG
jgi:hypothetical protein